MWNPHLAGRVQPTGLGNKGMEYPKMLLEIRASGSLSARAPAWGRGFKAFTTRLVVRPAEQVGSMKEESPYFSAGSVNSPREQNVCLVINWLPQL